MNRRNFLKHSALALFGFTVLPPAETYQRLWKAQKNLQVFNPHFRGEWGQYSDVNPAWANAPLEVTSTLHDYWRECPDEQSMWSKALNGVRCEFRDGNYFEIPKFIGQPSRCLTNFSCRPIARSRLTK